MSGSRQRSIARTPPDLFDRLDDYFKARDAAYRQDEKDITALDTFAADSILNKGRGSFDASMTPDLPPIPAHLYDFMFYLLLHPGASTSSLAKEFSVTSETVLKWKSDPRVLAYFNQMQAEIRSINMAQVSLLERAARNKAIEILNMRSSAATIEEQGRLIRFILDMTARMRGLQDGPLVNVNVSGGNASSAYSGPPQSEVDRVIDLADELLAKRRAMAKLKQVAEDVESSTE